MSPRCHSSFTDYRFCLEEYFAVHSLKLVQLFETPWTAAFQVSLSFTISWNLLKLMSNEWVMRSKISSSATPFSRPQSFPASGSFPMSQLFTSKYWCFSFSVSPYSEYSGLISFRIDCFDLLMIIVLSDKVQIRTSLKRQSEAWEVPCGKLSPDTLPELWCL